MKPTKYQQLSNKLASLLLVSLFLIGTQVQAGSKTKRLPYFSRGTAQILPPEFLPEGFVFQLPEGFVECEDLVLPPLPVGLPLGPVVAVDEGRATLIGKYTSIMELDQYAISPTEVVFYGPTIITSASGDSIVSLLNVTLSANADGVSGKIKGTFTAMGGTGKWAGVCGKGIVRGRADLVNGSFDYLTAGSLIKQIEKKRRGRYWRKNNDDDDD